MGPRPGQRREAAQDSEQGRPGQGRGEIAVLKKQLHGLAADVLEGNVDRGDAAVVNQILNTLIRAIEQERKIREIEEIEERLSELERRKGVA